MPSFGHWCGIVNRGVEINPIGFGWIAKLFSARGLSAAVRRVEIRASVSSPRECALATRRLSL